MTRIREAVARCAKAGHGFLPAAVLVLGLLLAAASPSLPPDRPHRPAAPTPPAAAPEPGTAAPPPAAPPDAGEAAPDDARPRPDFAGRAERVRGLYLTGYTAGNPDRLAALLRLAKEGGLNAMVIDAKDDDGRVTWRSDVPLAAEIGANSDKIPDIQALIRTLEENDIYPIARVVVFCDPLLSRRRPEWAVRVDGRLWRDRRGLSWTNPYLREVWEYNVEVAKAAARAGFREIQFDYVRLPEHDLPGFTAGMPLEKRVEAITNFLRYARQELEPLGVKLSADVFGLTTTVTDDMKIGQDYAAIAAVVDYISPMVYPSHYSPGNYGLPDPEARPYETVYNSMMKAREKTPDLPLERHRPWIQDFSLRHRYGAAEVEAQIRALADAGIRQFLLWNPNNRYTPGVNYRLIEAAAPPPEPHPSSPPEPGTPAPAGAQGDAP